MSPVANRTDALVVFATIALLALGWLIYAPAISGAFLLDDAHNLGGLSRISDVSSAIQFVFSGSAGPVGRPLSLATFVPQAEDWGGAAAPFLRVNILLHLLNGLLACWFFYQLAATRKLERVDAQTVAIAAMALWLFMPLLASSSLMVIQRMATLSALFVLIGLNIYLLFRTRLSKRPRASMVGMSLAIIFAGSMAVLAKENGALLVTFILVLEVTLLPRPNNIDLHRWRTWQFVMLGAPTLAIFTAIVLQPPYSDAVVLQKGFSASERLLTEARVLWEYLFHGFAAQPSEFGPFHDSYPISTSIFQPFTFIAVAGWIAVISFAIRYRRRFAVAAFAALWFLTGHLLESTSVPLYLYFEHRNYVAMMGPVFAASYFLLRAAGRLRNVIRVGLILYVLVNMALLYSVTSLWGSPQLAAKYWQSHSPNSADAAGYLAGQQLSRNEPEAAIDTLQNFARQHPEHAYLLLPALTLSCRTVPDSSHRNAISFLTSTLPRVSFAPEVGPMLDQLLDVSYRADCKDVDPEIARNLILAVYTNPRFSSNKKHSSIHHQLLAKFARNTGNIDEALRQLLLAKTARPSNEIHFMIVSMLADEGRIAEARHYIDEATSELTANPFKKAAGETMLKELQQYIVALESRK